MLDFQDAMGVPPNQEIIRSYLAIESIAESSISSKTNKFTRLCFTPIFVIRILQKFLQPLLDIDLIDYDWIDRVILIQQP